jgi:hypothetical protein
MHRNILKKEQVELLPLIKIFKKDFYLAGGTAIAVHIGHRYSLDFDLFTSGDIKRKGLKMLMARHNYTVQQILFEDSIQLHCIVNGVKLTFFQFPYPITPSVEFEKTIKMPDLLTLAAMKAFALGGRGKWKDYVDLYYIFKNHYAFEQVTEKAGSLFGDAFNEKLFKQQLAYFDDISFEEEVEYVTDPVSENEIKNYLTKIALKQF